LPAAIQQRYKLAIIRYLQFCKQSHQPATVASARQLMRQTEDARQLLQSNVSQDWPKAVVVAVTQVSRYAKAHRLRSQACHRLNGWYPRS
jgi:hypothetical protein